MSSAPERRAGDLPAPSAQGGRPAVFLDRDGTLNVDTRYLPGPEKVELHAGVIEGVALLRSRGFVLVVVTNQSGINRKLYTRSAVEAIHARIQELLAKGGTRVDAFYYCPHAPEEGCACRKPGTALFEQAVRELGLTLDGSWVVGDRWLDVEAAQRLKVRSAYVPEPAFRPRYPDELERARATADVVADSFLEACRALVARAGPG